MPKTTGWLCGFVLALAAGPVHAQATGTLSEAVGDLAKDVKKFLDTKGRPRLTIGQFPGTGDLARLSSAGPLLQTALEKRLKELGVEIVQKQGDYELRGEYTEMEDLKTGRQFVQIKLELRDRQGGTVHFEGIDKGKAVKYFVKNEDDLAKVLGTSVYIPADSSQQDRVDAYKKQVDRPETVFDGTRILAGKDKAGRKAPFALEVLTAPPRPGGGPHQLGDYQARTPKDQDGLAFVPIAKKEVYAVRLINDADFDAAVDLRIDGLSMFHASAVKDAKNCGPAYRYVIIPKNSSVVVRGWFVNLKQSDEFLVTEYAKSEAGKLGQSANVGTITATFHAAWDRAKGSPPPDEPKNPEKYSQSADATGRGDRIDQEYRVVDYQLGVFRAAVSVRYAK